MRGDQWLTKLLHSLNWGACISCTPYNMQGLDQCCEPIFNTHHICVYNTHMYLDIPHPPQSLQFLEVERKEIPTLRDTLLIDQNETKLKVRRYSVNYYLVFSKGLTEIVVDKSVQLMIYLLCIM